MPAVILLVLIAFRTTTLFPGQTLRAHIDNVRSTIEDLERGRVMCIREGFGGFCIFAETGLLGVRAAWLLK